MNEDGNEDIAFTKKSPRKALKWLALSTAGVIVVLLAALFVVWRWYVVSLGPVASESREVLVTIEPGSSALQIADTLEEHRVIKSSTAFNWYVNRRGVKDVLKAGTYKFDPSHNVAAIVDKLVEGRVEVRRVLIPPGLRLDEIKKRFIDAGYAQAEVDSGFSVSIDHPLLDGRPEGSSLEGYIFPDTYQAGFETTVEEILRLSFDEFYSRLTGEVMAGIERKGLTLHQAVILASIVQEEEPDPETQRAIAQVFLLRLERGIALGADPTFVYGAALKGVEPSPTLDSPYNTRLHKGLPPGPIANFNFSALAAVADPASGDYLYFFHGDDGMVRFSRTNTEHEALIEQFCKERCR